MYAPLLLLYLVLVFLHPALLCYRISFFVVVKVCEIGRHNKHKKMSACVTRRVRRAHARRARRRARARRAPLDVRAAQPRGRRARGDRGAGCGREEGGWWC